MPMAEGTFRSALTQVEALLCKTLGWSHNHAAPYGTGRDPASNRSTPRSSMGSSRGGSPQLSPNITPASSLRGVHLSPAEDTAAAQALFAQHHKRRVSAKMQAGRRYSGSSDRPSIEREASASLVSKAYIYLVLADSAHFSQSTGPVLIASSSIK